jgi:stage III sporulation protein AB
MTDREELYVENIVKLVGASLIMLSGSLIGWIFSIYYTNRVKELEDLKTGLILLENEINFNHTKLAYALQLTGKAVKPPISSLFLKAAEKLDKEKGKEFILIWQEVIQLEKNNTSLSKDDYDLICEWGRQIDSTSLNEQSNIHQASINKLEVAIENASKTADKKVKLSRYTGTLLSLLIIILFY